MSGINPASSGTPAPLTRPISIPGVAENPVDAALPGSGVDGINQDGARTSLANTPLDQRHFSAGQKSDFDLQTFEQLDRNLDDRLTGSEISEELKGADENGDGIITRGEQHRFMGAGASGISAGDRFNALDQNADGVLTGNEAANPKWANGRDANSDGQITLDEFKEVRARQILENKFKDYDQDGDGFLSGNNLQAGRLAARDTDQDGRLSLDDWLGIKPAPEPEPLPERRPSHGHGLEDAFKDSPEVLAALATLPLEATGSNGDTLGKLLKSLVDSEPLFPRYTGPNGGQRLAAEVIRQLASPETISQGVGTSTCTTAALQTILARSEPAEYARIALELATSRQTVLAGGATMSLEASDFRNDDKRSALSDAFQEGLFRLGSHQPPTDGVTSQGPEAGSNPEESPAGHGQTGLNISQFHEVSYQVLGDVNLQLRSSRKFLDEMVAENATNQTFFLKPEGDGAIGHAVVVTGWEGNTALLADPARGQVRMALDDLAEKTAFFTMPSARVSGTWERVNAVQARMDFGLTYPFAARPNNQYVTSPKLPFKTGINI